MNKLTEMINLRNAFVGTAALTILSLLTPDVAEALGFGGASNSRDDGNDQISFDIDIDFSQELVPGMYSGVISNYLHENTNNINIFSNPGQTYNLLIQPCCSNPELIDDGVDNNMDGMVDDAEFQFARQEIAETVLPFGENYFETASDFLQYTILIDSASTNLAGFETINNGIFSFVIDRDLGLTGVANIFPNEQNDPFNFAETFGNYLYSPASFQEQLTPFEAVGLNFVTTPETVPEPSTILGLFSFVVLGTGKILKMQKNRA